MTMWHFVAGEQHCQIESRNVLDAFLVLSNRKTLAREFRETDIEAYDDNGTLAAKRSWESWKRELLKDTYGSNFEQVLDNAQSLCR